MNQTIDIVIPHVEKLAQWHELKYALRSIHQNYKGSFRIWIVGDKPAWLSKKANFISMPCTGLSPRIDVMHKIMAVIDNKGVKEEFFWSNDDIYFINKLTYADLCIPKVIGDLIEKVNRINHKSVYTDDIRATFETLKINKLPILNYSTHLPYRFEKQKMLQLVERFDLMNRRLLPENLYYNTYHADELPYHLSLENTNNIMFSINRPSPNWQVIEQQMQIKKWLNNSEAGMTPQFQKFLDRMFPEPSPFEK